MPLEPISDYTNARVAPVINPEEALASMKHVAFAASQTIPAGSLLGKVTVGGKYKAYNNANSDGSEVAVPLITEYPITTDASGNVTSLGGDQPGTMLTAPVWTQGNFRCEHIPNLDANGLADIGGKILTGTIDTGEFRF